MQGLVRNNKGFSLVELMVVVAIIGILAAIAIPNFQRFTAKSKQSEAKAVLSALYSAERAFSSEWQTFSSGFNSVGYRPTGLQRYAHGFAAAFPAAGAYPQGYSGPQDVVNFNSSVATMCALTGNIVAATGCGTRTLPIPPGAVAGTAMAISTFLAQARGHIGNATAATVDIWTIDQNKSLVNTQDGLP